MRGNQAKLRIDNRYRFGTNINWEDFLTCDKTQALISVLTNLQLIQHPLCTRVACEKYDQPLNFDKTKRGKAGWCCSGYYKNNYDKRAPC